jgi:hypothetical protein
VSQSQMEILEVWNSLEIYRCVFRSLNPRHRQFWVDQKNGSARVTCLQVWSTAMPNLKDSPQPPLPRSHGGKTTAAMVHSKMRFSLSGKCCNGAKVDFSWPLSTLWSTCLYLILKQSSTRIYQQYIHANAPRWSRLPADKKLQRATLRQADWLHFKPQVNRQFQNTKNRAPNSCPGISYSFSIERLTPPDMGSKRSRSVIPSHEPLELELVKRILCFILWLGFIKEKLYLEKPSLAM